MPTFETPSTDWSRLWLAVALTFVAGWVDATGLLKLGGLFVSFMSGDTTQLAVAGAHSAIPEAIAAGRVIVIFVVGVMVGRLFFGTQGQRRRTAVLWFEALLLGLAAGAPAPDPVLVTWMILAMGVQNAALHSAGTVKPGLTYVTGTLVRLGEALADAMFGRPGRDTLAWVPYLLLWLGLVLGAVAGTLAFGRYGMRALAAPAALVFAAGVREAISRSWAPELRPGSSN